ncbi:ankyrin repeat domain-containing protein [Candidatus Wolbachia massiliensis]|uniref:ankyrin repeat domain-containing protein n=1 Tax=Candidatus Wolbachia massiliensis TaxID=1845000 RepID=UPI001CD0EF4C|nr:ankyrin repeat domain-containing protein [Candidatus Wolbachia massiliensis]
MTNQTDSLDLGTTSLSSNNSSWVDLDTEKNQETSSTATTLEFQLTQSLLSQVKAGEDNKDANSGKQAYKDLPRMSFVINGQTIDNNFVNQLCTEYDQNDKRQAAKHVFIKMFEHAKAEVPNHHILEELITDCNQAGYEFAMYGHIQPIFNRYDLTPTIPKKTISLCCNSANSVSVEYSDVIVVKNPDQLEQYESGSKLEFALKFQNGKVEYENGKATLTIPEQLKAYKADGRSLLGDINKHFEDSFNSSKTTNKAVTDPGILDNIANAFVGAAEIVTGTITELLWPQDQINVEPGQNEEEFTIIWENLTFDELVGAINKAKNHGDYKDLDEVVNNIREGKESDRFITDLNHDNFGKFCSQQLNLTDHMYNVLLNNRYDGNYSYSVRELALLAIAANDTLVEEYAKTHKDILFTQDEDLDRLLIGVGGQHYIKFLLEHLEKKLDPILPWHGICEKLERALSINNQECIEAVLDKFSNIEFTSRVPDYSSKLLHYAIQQDFKDVAKIIIDHKVVDINSIDNLGNAPLHYAVARNNLKLIDLLIKNGAEVDIKDERYGRTALNWAAYHSKFEIVKLLVKAGADWNTKDKDGKTALDLIGTRPKLSQERDTLPTSESETTKFLKDLDGTTPLHYAVEKNNFDTAEKFLAKGVNVDVKNSDNWTPLSRAIVSNNLRFVKLLLDHGADTNIEIQDGHNTHLSWAINRNGTCKSDQTREIIELLLDKNANIGERELKEAITAANFEIVKLLVNKGAVITQEIVQYADKTCKDCKEGRSHISKYPDGLEGEKQTRAKILGFLEGKFKKDPEPKSTDSQQSQKNVDNGKNIMNNRELSTKQPISVNYKGGGMYDSGQNTKSLEDKLSDAIQHIDLNQVKYLIQKKDIIVNKSIVSKANQRLVDFEQGSVAGKGKKNSRKKQIKNLKEIIKLLEEKVPNINANTVASSIGGKDVGAQAPVQPVGLEGSEGAQAGSPPPSPNSSASGGSGSSFSVVSPSGSSNDNGYVKVFPEDVAEEDPTSKGSSPQGTQPEIPVPPGVSPNVGDIPAAEEPIVTTANIGDGGDQQNSLQPLSPFIPSFPPSLMPVSDDKRTGTFSIASEDPSVDDCFSIASEDSSILDVTDEEEPLSDKREDDAQDASKQPSTPGKNDSAPQNTKGSNLYIIAASVLAIAGVALGIAIAVHLEMLAVGIAVGACCLIAAAAIYYCAPQSSVEGSKVEGVVPGGKERSAS